MASGKYGYWLTDDGRLLIAAWARDGLTDKELAVKMHISVSTLYEWKKKHPEISESIKKTKEIVNVEVENSLLRRCHGYDAVEQRAFKCKRVFYDDQNRRCEEEEIRVAEVRIHIPADTTAIAIWLNNCTDGKWRRNAGKEALDAERFRHQKEMDKEKLF